MSTAYNRNEVDIQSSLQSVRHKLIAKDITLQRIKQRQTAIGFINQLRYTSRFEGSDNQSWFYIGFTSKYSSKRFS